MEFVPFGQDGIPPTAGKATKCRMLYYSVEFVYKKGIEAFNPMVEIDDESWLFALVDKPF
jgi:hypothetical protein